MTIFYHDGGPGPAMHLLKVEAEPGGELSTWCSAPAYQWNPTTGGWYEFHEAQADIMYLGEYFPVAASEVPKVQEGMLEWRAQFQ